MSHTPGPWTKSGPRIGTAAGTICTLYYADDRTGRGQTAEQREANARLIAAAPELLAACEVTLANLDLIGTHPDTLPRCRRALKAAIAKAKGGDA